MKLKIFRSTWGLVDASDGQKANSPHRTLDTAIPDLKSLGYDGVEIPLKSIFQFGKENFKKILEENEMQVIVMVFTDGPVAPGHHGNVFGGPYEGFSVPTEPGARDKDLIVAQHLTVFKEQVEAAQEFNPVLVNSHSCKDYFTTEMASKFFTDAIAWQKSKGYKVHHETHRKRFLYSPWVARDFVPTIDEGLTLVADLSHWISVAETNCDDPDLTQVIEDLAPRCKHIHMRVGYDHGPQVPDPRSPEWLPYVEGHERWWDAIMNAAHKSGDEEFTVTTEFGPPNYQVCVPGTGEPLANVWDVNHWIALRRQVRFAQLFGEPSTGSLIPSKTQDEKPDTNPGDSILANQGRVGFV